MKAALTACSNPVSSDQQEDIKRLTTLLEKEGLEVVTSPYLFGCHGNSPERIKAKELTGYFRDSGMDFIFDISGGDIANSILPELDYEAIRESRAVFCGYSDLTTILNAVYAKADRETMNYQIRNLLYDHSELELAYFREHILKSAVTEADLEYQFLRGDSMTGRVLGGNIRCLLKLAGTPFWPDLNGAILMLESYRGGVMQMTTLLHQLKQIGVFEQINGILLGTFSAMEDEQLKPTIAELVQKIVPKTLPIAVTRYIGHRTDARAIVIGREYVFGRDHSRSIQPRFRSKEIRSGHCYEVTFVKRKFQKVYSPLNQSHFYCLTASGKSHFNSLRHVATLLSVDWLPTG